MYDEQVTADWLMSEGFYQPFENYLRRYQWSNRNIGIWCEPDYNRLGIVMNGMEYVVASGYEPILKDQVRKLFAGLNINITPVERTHV